MAAARAAASRPRVGACGARALASRAAMIPGVRRPLADVVHLDRLEPEKRDGLGAEADLRGEAGVAVRRPHPRNIAQPLEGACEGCATIARVLPPRNLNLRLEVVVARTASQLHTHHCVARA